MFIMKIAIETIIGGVKYKLSFIDKLGDGTLMGESSCIDTSIKIARSTRQITLSDAAIFNTYWHEVIHMILDDCGYTKLSRDEQFVIALSGKVCELINNTKFITVEEAKQELNF